MENEQTIDEIMKAVGELANAEVQYSHWESSLRAGACERKSAALRHAITAALAAKDAEIERLNHAYHQQREDAQSRVDAAVLRALAAEREIERLKAQLAEPAKPEPGEWVEWKGGECPIADDVRHQIRTRDGWESNVDTDAYGWNWTNRHGDDAIVAYRIIP